MFLLRKSSQIIHPSEMTPRAVFETRRQFMKQIAAGTLASAALLEMINRNAFAENVGGKKLTAMTNPNYLLRDKKTSYKA